MKALILASGTGSRLMPLTKNIPKCCICVGTKSLLERQINALISIGVNDFIITTGAFHNKIGEKTAPYVSAGLSISLIYNELYDRTNYIYSLYKCRNLIDCDIYLLHGDLIFDDWVLNSLKDYQPDAVIVNSNVKSPSKDFKAEIRNGYVYRISVDCCGQDCPFCAPIYKLSSASMGQWMDTIARFVSRGETSCYAENALNEFLPGLKLVPFDIAGHQCMEIDTVHDLRLAERLFS
jgi:phosphoenolpyruvate phosphomutase